MASKRTGKALSTQRASAPTYWWRRITRPAHVKIDGFTVEVDEARVGTAVAKALWRGTYEAAERFLVRTFIGETDRVIEAGAGLGVVSMNIARIVGANNLIVYEASPVTADLLKRNLHRNGFAVDVRQRGLSDSDVGERFVHADDFRGSSSVAEPGGLALEIPTDDIARVMAEFSANALVLDIEGKEIDVLLRAPLDAIEKVIVEIHPRLLGDLPYLPLYRCMFDSGFILRHERIVGSVLPFVRV